MRAGLILLCELICALCLGDPSFAQDRVRIAYVGPSLSNLPLLAAKETGIFARHKLDVEILLLTSQLSAVALGAGELEYVAGVGPGSVGGTLAGIPSRAVWVVSNRISTLGRRATGSEVFTRLARKKDRRHRIRRDDAYRVDDGDRKSSAAIQGNISSSSARTAATPAGHGVESCRCHNRRPAVVVSCAEKRLQQDPRSRLGRRDAGGWFDHNDEDIKLKVRASL